MADIKLENVTKRFPDGYEAVRDMNLDIKDGEFMILSGRRAAASRPRCG